MVDFDPLMRRFNIPGQNPAGSRSGKRPLTGVAAEARVERAARAGASPGRRVKPASIRILDRGAQVRTGAAAAQVRSPPRFPGTGLASSTGIQSRPSTPASRQAAYNRWLTDYDPHVGRSPRPPR